MLAHELNQKLTQVGHATPMGELLRRYWHPVAVASDLDKEPVMPVKILGEELTLFRMEGGELGLVSRRCPHRGASLEFGFPEKNGLRCCYHGWLFDKHGRCIEQPSELDGVDRRARATLPAAYPVQELGGLLWTYMGPSPAPLLPRYDLFVREDVDRNIGVTPSLPCNWFQMMENSLDPVHLEWLHGHYFNYRMKLKGLPPVIKIKKHLKIGFDVFEFGIRKRRLVEGASEDSDDWTRGHPILFPNILAVGAEDGPEFQIRVPIDDRHTKYYWYYARPRAQGAAPQTKIPVFENRYREEDGRLIVDTINGQDMMIFLTQGAVANRDVELLGSTDKGILLLRRVVREQLEKVARGEDPLAVLRDPAKNTIIVVPRENHAYYTTTGDMLTDKSAEFELTHRKKELTA